MSIDVSELFRDFFSRVFSDREVAENFVADPEGVLAAEGITDADLSGVNVAQVAAVVAQESALPPETKDAVAQVASGGGGGGEQDSGDGGPAADGGQPPLEQIVQTVTELVTVVHQDIDQSTSFFDQSTTIDNSVDVDVDGANASVVTTGDGNVVNTGEGDVNAATGDGSQAIGGDNDGQANTGDGAVLAGDDVENVNTGENSGVVGDGDNTFGDGNVDFGEGNDLANLNFGSGVQDQSSNSINNSDQQLRSVAEQLHRQLQQRTVDRKRHHHRYRQLGQRLEQRGFLQLDRGRIQRGLEQLDRRRPQ